MKVPFKKGTLEFYKKNRFKYLNNREEFRMKYILGICSLLLAALPVYALMGDESSGGYMDTNVHCPDKTPVVRGVNEQEYVSTLTPAVEKQRRQQRRRGSQDSVQ